jgi:flagellar hook assembly protein FlgD
MLGQEVKSLVDAVQAPGNHSVVWDGQNDRGENVSSGIYFYTLQAGNFLQQRKMILLR